jgi:hypothetical protein
LAALRLGVELRLNCFGLRPVGKFCADRILLVLEIPEKSEDENDDAPNDSRGGGAPRKSNRIVPA